MKKLILNRFKRVISVILTAMFLLSTISFEVFAADPKVSIIIPVYNTPENLLRDCLESAKNQTLKDIEIICVDDGSTGESGKILDEYARNDPRFVVVHQTNKATSEIRDSAMKIAKGKCVKFLDSCVKIDSNTLEKYYNQSIENDKNMNKPATKYNVYYWTGKSNFGEQFCVCLLKYFNIEYIVREVNKAEYFFINSELAPAFSSNRNAIKIFGSGIKLDPKNSPNSPKNVDAYCLRGKLAKHCVEKITGKETNCLLGDPGLLFRDILPCNEQKIYDVGIICHFSDKGSKYLKNIKLKEKSHILIDVLSPIHDVVKKINQCKLILSSAMHPIIASDSYGIPNRRIILKDKKFYQNHILEDRTFKFNDYYSIYDNIKVPDPIDLTCSVITDKDVDTFISEYNIPQNVISNFCSEYKKLMNSYFNKQNLTQSDATKINKIKSLLNQKNLFFVENEPLKNHTSFQIGGDAAIVAYPNSESEVLNILEICKNNNVPLFILGKGSNLIVSDQGFKGVIISTKHLNKIKLMPDDKIYCECGVYLPDLCDFALQNSLSGLEFACGIPGSVGGAVFMNAGAYGGEMKNVIQSVNYMDDLGKMNELKKDDLNFSFRHSIFQKHKNFILSAILKLSKSEKSKIKSKMDELTYKRKQKQPLELPSAGSIFLPPKGIRVHELIKLCGLQGETIGKAQVSLKNPTFIVNLGGATSEDVNNLIKKIQKVVFEKTGIFLKTEVECVNDNISEKCLDYSTKSESYNKIPKAIEIQRKILEIEDNPKSTDTKTIEDGVYIISSKLNPNMCLDINGNSKNDKANLQLWQKNNSDAQKFKIQYNSDGYYTITAMCSGKPIDVASAGKKNGTNIWQYKSNGSDAQKWFIVPDGEGYYCLVSKCNNLCMDICGGQAKNGSNIHCWTIHGGDNQRFKLEKCEDNSAEVKKDDVKSNSNKSAEVKENAVKPSANKPAEAKKDSVKPSSNKPAEIKKDAVKPNTNKPAEAKKNTVKPSANKPAEVEKDSDKPSENKPAEIKKSA